MTQISDIDLSAAEKELLVANTPLFLARKLRDNPAVRRMGLEIGSNEILDCLKTYETRSPTTSREAVLPYACLVALSLKSDASGLRQATLINAPAYRWFDYIRTVLLQLHRSSASTRIVVPPIARQPSVEKRTNAAASSVVIMRPPSR